MPTTHRAMTHEPWSAEAAEASVTLVRTRRPLAALESGGQSGAVHIVPWSIWRGQKEMDIVAGLQPRERALMSYSRIFAGGALTNTELDEESLRPYVELVFNEFSGKLWPLREDDIAKTMRNVPPEALRDISSEEFFAEYHRLRCWLGAMRASLVGREVLSLSRLQGRQKMVAPLASGRKISGLMLHPSSTPQTRTTLTSQPLDHPFT